MEEESGVGALDSRSNPVRDHIPQVEAERVAEKVIEVRGPAGQRKARSKRVQQLTEWSHAAGLVGSGLPDDREAGLASKASDSQRGLGED